MKLLKDDKATSDRGILWRKKAGLRVEEGSGATRAPELRIAKKLYRRRLAKKALTFFSGAFIVSTIIYLCFAITIIRVLPTNNAGFIPVRNLTAEGGISKPGDQIVVNVKDAQGDGMLDRAKQSLLMTSNAAVVQVKAGPYGKIASQGKNVYVNGRKVNVSLVHALEKPYLSNEYVVTCLKGNCVVGMSFIVPAQNVYGEPLNSYVDGDSTVNGAGK